MKNHSVKIIFFSIILFFSWKIVAQNIFSSANRKTAIRYLQSAKKYAEEKSWQEVLRLCETALNYDDGISDLWYLSAAAKINLGSKKSEALSLVERALNESDWVDYNRDSARILYADLLYKTTGTQKIFEILDSKPQLFSSDAEFLRAAAYYKIGTKDAIERAREKIDAARKIFPLDSRFPLLFFRFEQKIAQKNAETKLAQNSLVKRLSDFFLDSKAFGKYSDSNVELEIYCAIFSEGENRTRALKSFSARGMKHILFAAAALRDGILSEEAALDYFLTFFQEKTVDFDDLVDFSSLLTEESNRKYFCEVLNAYDGKITFDTNGDLIPDLFAEYKRGRPQKIVYDKNQDDALYWIMNCDFGVPLEIEIIDSAQKIFYADWPSAQRTTFSVKNENLTFNLEAEKISWTPCKILASQKLRDFLGIDFFIPSLLNVPKPEIDDFLKASTSYEIPSLERRNAKIEVSLLDGVPQTAFYSANGKIYARAKFEDGLPLFRSVDRDEDGLFETTEFYGFDPDLEQNFFSESDEKQIMTNLFGVPGSGAGFYLKMVQIDFDKDTIPDFIEEYFENGGKISSWDEDKDGIWDSRYVLYGTDESKITKEEALFRKKNGEVVSVYSENGEPKSVKEGGVTSQVIQDESGIYWIGEAGTSLDSEKILQIIKTQDFSGMKVLDATNEKRILLARAGKFTIAQLLPSSKNEEIEENQNLEQKSE